MAGRVAESTTNDLAKNDRVQKLGGPRSGNEELHRQRQIIGAVTGDKKLQRESSSPEQHGAERCHENRDVRAELHDRYQERCQGVGQAVDELEKVVLEPGDAAAFYLDTD